MLGAAAMGIVSAEDGVRPPGAFYRDPPALLTGCSPAMDAAVHAAV